MPVFDQGGSEFPKGDFGGGPGGGGGGGGGGFSSFAGGIGNPLGGGTPFGQNLSTRKKVTLRGGTMLGERAPSDTVPAWLEPGEFVEPVESVAMFGPLLEAIRQEGLRMRMGGMVPDPRASGYMDGGPVDDPFMDAPGMSLGGWLGKHWWMAPVAAMAAPALAGMAAGWGAGMPALTSGLGAAKAALGPSMGVGSALASLDPQDAQMTPADIYQHLRQREQSFAMGGPVNWMGKAQRQPTQGGFTVSTGGQTARPQQTYQPFAQTPGPQQPPGVAPTLQSQWGAPTTDLQNPATGPYGDLGRAIGQFGQQGFYDPQGSQMTEEAMRAKALQDAQAYATQAGLAADVSGMDPAQAAAYRMQARVNAGRGVGQAMTDYRARIASERDAWARQLFGMNFEEASKQLGRFQDYRHASRLGGGR